MCVPELGMVYLYYSIAPILPWVLYALWIFLWCHIFHRAGFSRWWGITAILAIVPVIILAVSKWPIETRLGVARGEIDPDAESAYDMIEEGARLERQNQYEAALEQYTRIISLVPGTEAANDARIARDGILRRLEAESRYNRDAPQA